MKILKGMIQGFVPDCFKLISFFEGGGRVQERSNEKNMKYFLAQVFDGGCRASALALVTQASAKTWQSYEINST
jgi:hypothetical protein